MRFFQSLMGLQNPKNNTSLEGIWERVGDHFEGCIIKVEQEKQELLGKIIVSTQEMLLHGWLIGDKKWRYIQHNPKTNLWQLLDLRKQYDTQNKKLLSTDYASYMLMLNSDGRKLYLYQPGNQFFAAQTWVKVG